MDRLDFVFGGGAGEIAASRGEPFPRGDGLGDGEITVGGGGEEVVASRGSIMMKAIF